MKISVPIRPYLLLVFAFLLAALNCSASEKDLLSLEELTQRSGLIFQGRVLQVEMPESSAVQDGTGALAVRITFRVDDGIRGVKSGDLVTVQEWASGTRGAQRYKIGEKLLMFYHRPNASGLTSPVGGAAGRIPITARNEIRLAPERMQSLLRSPRLREVAQKQALPEDTKKSLAYSDFARALRLVSAESAP